MKCPDKELLQDLVDGELSESKIPHVVEHIRSCGHCKTEFTEIFAVHNALTEIVTEDTCPSIEDLDAYAQQKLALDQIDTVKQHAELCGRCRSYLWLFQASEAELESWQADEQAAFEEFKAKKLGYEPAREILGKLLPTGMNMFDQLWQSVLVFVADLKDNAVEQLPSFTTPVQLAGVLGFSETEPETTATSIILATTLYVSQQISDGSIKAGPSEIETAIQKAAIQFGAGKELQKRIAEIAPEILLKFG